MSNIQTQSKLNVVVPRPQQLNLCPTLAPSQHLAVCDFKTSGIGLMLQSDEGRSAIEDYLIESIENIDLLAGIEKPKRLSAELQDLIIMGIMEVVKDFCNLTFGQFKRALISGMSGKYDPDGKVYGFTAKDVRQWLNAYMNELKTEHLGAIQKQLEYEQSREVEMAAEAQQKAHEETQKAILSDFADNYEQLRESLAGKQVAITDIPEEIDRGNILYKGFWKAKLIRCTREEWDALVVKKKTLILSELPGILRAAKSTKRSQQISEHQLVDYEQGKAEVAARSHIFRQKVAEYLMADIPAKLILQKLNQ